MRSEPEIRSRIAQMKDERKYLNPLGNEINQYGINQLDWVLELPTCPPKDSMTYDEPFPGEERSDVLELKDMAERAVRACYPQAFKASRIKAPDYPDKYWPCGRSKLDEAKIAVCAYCGGDIGMLTAWTRGGIDFCCKHCADRFDYNPVECPRLDNLPGQANIPEPARSSQEEPKTCLPDYCALCCDRICDQRTPRTVFKCPTINAFHQNVISMHLGQSASQHDHRWILGYITRCLKDQLPYPKIIEELKFHEVEMSPAELAEYLKEMT